MGEDKRLEISDLGLGIFYFSNFFPARAVTVWKILVWRSRLRRTRAGRPRQRGGHGRIVRGDYIFSKMCKYSVVLSAL